MSGFLRKYGIELYVPIDILKIIKSMYSNEIIHLFSMAYDKHYCISLESILYGDF